MYAPFKALAIFALSAAVSQAMAFHDCGVAPGQVKMVGAGEYLSIWKGNNWKGHVFVIAVSEKGGRAGTFWINYPGSQRQALKVVETPAVAIDAPSNGAELRAVFESPTLVMACALRTSDETVESITARLVTYKKACDASRQCWLDQGKLYEVPHSSILFPSDAEESHTH